MGHHLHQAAQLAANAVNGRSYDTVRIDKAVNKCKRHTDGNRAYHQRHAELKDYLQLLTVHTKSAKFEIKPQSFPATVKIANRKHKTAQLAD